MTTLWPDASDLAIATNHQREIYAQATRGPVAVVGGNPGTGKSHLAGQIIKCVASQYGMSNVSVCAFTGKAAQVITEVMQSNGIQDLQATTIHRMLGPQRNGHDRKGWGFLHNARNPLKKRFVFCDEASMLGCSIGSSLLDALFPGTHFMPMGDFCQLPPVEHGRLLYDAILAGLPYGELVEIIRNKGDVVTACQDVKDGRPFSPSRYVDIEAGKNFKHIQCARPMMALSALSSLLKSPPPGLDPMWDIQVLCAVNDNTDVCRLKLNGLVQRILNPHNPDKPEYTKGHTTYRRDDKVICLSNGMIPLAHCPECLMVGGMPDFSWDGKTYECMTCGHAWVPKECVDDFVANGEIGKVIAVRENVIHVSFDAPKRVVRVSGEWLGAFDLAYAVTTHKSQGSAWPICIVMADDSFAADRVTSWEHHRTSWSRVRKLCISIGNKAAIDRQCRKSALAGRKTFLPAMVKRLMGLGTNS